ncbi:MAG TPA: outer membrane lipid asymmetry maintenance protein MlaD [Candidatus Binatia bacterium]|nr:outer membrane lipid asymmetry maintenance protein MlaD [Candidatus Binatia bacterium]
MTQTRTEIIVGFFVLVGIACLGYLAIKLGKLEVLGNSGYMVYADFPSVAGLKIGDPVEIAGVKVGRVDAMGLVDDRARLQLRMQDGVKLQEDVIASVRARGLIGDKFVLITPGASDKIIPPGGKIRETESPPDIPDLIGKIVGGDLTSKSEKQDESKK